MNVETQFDYDQRVYIPELKTVGRINALFFTPKVSYRVRFFDNKEPREIYFEEDELAAIKGEPQIGFQG